MLNKNPIGIFDSGIGGLTVAKAIHDLLPAEDLIYFGDTAHLPYGDKSTAAIQAYAIKICNMLLDKQVKMIVIACNSASAAAFDLVKAYVGSKAVVANVIDPMVQLIAKQYENGTVGLIGTRQTVGSNIYATKLQRLAPALQLNQLATPLLAPMIEEGFHANALAKSVVENYLENPDLQQSQALVLACTHYPLIAHLVQQVLPHAAVLDSSTTVASHVQALLQLNGIENPQKTGSMQFYVSDYTDSFAASAGLFFGESIVLNHYPLWE